MRKMRTHAVIDLNDSVGEWNSSDDRWSRQAKHHLSHTELANIDDMPMFEEGDRVVYDGLETVVKIPDGPRGSVGIMVEGHLRMVHKSKVTADLREGVMGGVMAMPAINRMMQLAGLEHTGAVQVEVEQAALNEDAADTMIDNLARQAGNMAQFRDKPEAAKLYAIGSILSALHKSASGAPFNSTEALAKKKELDALGVFGADLIKTAQDMSAKMASAQAAGRSTGTGTAEE